jgi:hypothetical protein
MADRYWRGGSGTWSTTNTTNWSTTSGGAGGASVPTSSDDVYFDANSASGSYTVSISTTGTKNAKALTISNPTVGTITIGTATYNVNVHGDVNIISAGNTADFDIHFSSLISPGTYSISSATALRSVRFRGNATYNVTSNLSATFVLPTNGTVNFGAFTHSIETFSNDELSSSLPTTNTVVVNLDTCTINNLGLLEMYGVSTTLNAGTSTINARTFGNFTIGRTTDPAATPITLYDFTHACTANTTNNIYNQVTFNNLTLSISATTSRTETIFFANSTISDLTITGVLSGQLRPFISSDIQGTARTLTVTTATAVDYVDFQDITIAGGAAPISGTMLGDCGGNTDITFPASKNCFWNLLAGGGWAATAWAATSGGVVDDINFPLPQDTAIIENTGLNTNAIITLRGAANYGSLDWSTRTNNFSFNSNTGSYSFYGGISGGSALGGFINSITFRGGRTQIINITSSGKLNDFTISKSPSAVWQLANNLSVTGADVFYASGTIDLAGYTLFCEIFTFSGSGTKTIDGNNGKINVAASTATVFVGGTATVPSTTTLEITNPGSGSTRYIETGINSTNFNVSVVPTSTSSGVIIFTSFTTSNFTCNNLTFGNNFAGQMQLGNTMTLLGNFSYSNNASATIRTDSAFINRTLNLTPPTATTVTFDPKGKTLQQLSLTVNGADITSEVDLSSNLTLSRTFRVNSGTFRSNSYTINCRIFDSSFISGGSAREVDIGSSLVIFGTTVTSGTTTTFDMEDPNLTLTFTYASGAELRSVATTSVANFDGGDKAYPTLTLAGVNGTLRIAGDNSFENITNTVQPVGLRVTSGSNQTVNKFELSGTAGNLVTLDSTTTAQHTLTCPTGLDIAVNYLNISYSNAVGSIISTQWYAGANSTNSGNNTGWIFTNPPPPPKGEFFMIMLG